jgi:hypothetical protein
MVGRSNDNSWRRSLSSAPSAGRSGSASLIRRSNLSNRRDNRRILRGIGRSSLNLYKSLSGSEGEGSAISLNGRLAKNVFAESARSACRAPAFRSSRRSRADFRAS